MRFKNVKLASILCIIGNIFLLIIKGIIGLLTKSQAMIADSINSAVDIFSSLMTFIGNKIASRPRDDCHNLGHGKAEYIFSIWLIIVCIINIVIKFILYLYTNSISKKHNNLLMKASSKDNLNDCILTLCNLISCILGIFKIYIFDGIVGIIISIWIIYTSIKIFNESYNVLMDKSISNETKNKVIEIIKKYDTIKKINHFNSTPVGYRYQISFTIFVDGNLSTFESHDIANKLEKEIIKEIEEIYLVVIHVNPI